MNCNLFSGRIRNQSKRVNVTTRGSYGILRGTDADAWDCADWISDKEPIPFIVYGQRDVGSLLIVRRTKEQEFSLGKDYEMRHLTLCPFINF